MHIDWVSEARRYGSNPHITDINIRFQDIAGDVYEGKAYDPLLSKVLARWPYSTGQWVWQNADNMNNYGLAKYIQKMLNNVYPNFPVVTQENVKQRWKDLIVPGNGLNIQWNGSNPIFQQMAKSLNQCADDEDAGSTAAVLSMTAMAPDSSYPASYVSALVTTQTETLLTPVTVTSTPTIDSTLPPCLLTATYVHPFCSF